MIVPESREIAVLNRMNKAKAQITHKDIAFVVEAARKQLRDHVPLLYPGEPVWNVEYYERIEDIDLANVWPILLMDFDDDEGSNALHYAIGGLIGGTVDCLFNPLWSVHLMHELTEITGNPYLLEWRKVPSHLVGNDLAATLIRGDIITPRENADAVQNDLYNISVGMYGETRHILASNFVGQRYWGEPAPDDQPLDYMRKLTAPMQLGNGYRVLKINSRRVYEWGAAKVGGMSQRRFSGASRSSVLMQGKGFRVEREGDLYVASTPLVAGAVASARTPEEALYACRRECIEAFT